MITDTISSKDYLDALRLHRGKAVKRQLLVLCALAAVGCVVAAVVNNLVGIILIGAGVGGLIGEFILSTLTLPRRARNIYDQQAALRVKYAYFWDRGGVSVTSENANARRS